MMITTFHNFVKNKIQYVLLTAFSHCTLIAMNFTNYTLDVTDMSLSIDVGMVIVCCRLSIFVGEFFRNSLCQI